VIYRFNQFTLDTEQYQLCLSEKPVAVEPLAFDLLVYLIEHRDRVVTREELLDNLWEGKVVTDAALGARLKDARKAVGDSGKKQDIIKTLHGRGYQFIAKILEHSESTVTANRSADGDETAALPDKPSIAVLPFTNMSNDPEQEFFSDGITEDIITALSRISSMLVIARNSTFIYKGKAVDVKQVGRDQGVRYVLEGGVRKSGERVRITAQLVDTSNGQHLWAERYDRDLDDIFAVQDEITQKIVSELDVHLRSGEQARLFSRGTGNFEAWECVRLGSDLVNLVMGDQIGEAMRLLKRAIDLDPKYAAAWAWLAWSHYHIAEDYDSIYSEEERKQALESTRDCACQALEFDPSSADAHAALGLYHLSLSEHEAAIENINKSVQLAPNHANNIAISAAVLNKCGQPQKAIERIRKAMRLSPVYPSWNLSILGQAYRLASMFDVAIETYNELISADTDFLEGHIALAEIFGETNQPDQAAVSVKEVLRLNPDFTIKKYVGDLAYSDPAENIRFADGLRKAGLPE
jgi:TolB-like protein